MSIVANYHNSKPLTAKPTAVDHDAFLAELNAFNAECMLLTQTTAVITKTGADLDRLLKAGTENLSRDERGVYFNMLKEFETFIAEYKRRVAAQIAREKALKSKAKQLGVAVDFHSLSNSGNN